MYHILMYLLSSTFRAMFGSSASGRLLVLCPRIQTVAPCYCFIYWMISSFCSLSYIICSSFVVDDLNCETL